MSMCEVMRTARINERSAIRLWNEELRDLDSFKRAKVYSMQTQLGFWWARRVLARYRHDPRRAYALISWMARNKRVPQPARRAIRDVRISLFHHVTYHLEQSYHFGWVQRFERGDPDLVVWSPDRHAYVAYAKERFFVGYAVALSAFFPKDDTLGSIEIAMRKERIDPALLVHEGTSGEIDYLVRNGPPLRYAQEARAKVLAA